jgi:hypothetical protein
VVRRKDFSAFLVEWTGRFLEVLRRFTEEEKRRRKIEAPEAWNLLPWTVTSLASDDGAGPKVDLTVLGGAESLDGINLNSEQIASKCLNVACPWRGL